MVDGLGRPVSALAPQASPCHYRLAGLWVKHASHTAGCLLAARLYTQSVLADSTMLNVALLHTWGRFSCFFPTYHESRGDSGFLPSQWVLEFIHQGSVSAQFEG